jgi:hypothetical protein
MKKTILLLLALTTLPTFVCAQFASSGAGLGIDHALRQYILQSLDPHAKQDRQYSEEEIFFRNVRTFVATGKEDAQKREELREKIVEFLDADPQNVNTQDKYHNTALHWAAILGDTEMAELLFAYHIEAKVYNLDGRTPLHIARKYNRADFAKMLVAYDKKLPNLMYKPVK